MGLDSFHTCLQATSLHQIELANKNIAEQKDYGSTIWQTWFDAVTSSMIWAIFFNLLNYNNNTHLIGVFIGIKRIYTFYANSVLAPNKRSKYQWPIPSPQPSTTVNSSLSLLSAVCKTTSFLPESIVIMSHKASLKVFALNGGGGKHRINEGVSLRAVQSSNIFLQLGLRQKKHLFPLTP